MNNTQEQINNEYEYHVAVQETVIMETEGLVPTYSQRIEGVNTKQWTDIDYEMAADVAEEHKFFQAAIYFRNQAIIHRNNRTKKDNNPQ